MRRRDVVMHYNHLDNNNGSHIKLQLCTCIFKVAGHQHFYNDICMLPDGIDTGNLQVSTDIELESFM